MSSQSENPNSVPTVPRAVVHKKILDRAESRPDVSIDELANTVTGASPDLVERVLDEYGDPAADEEQTNKIEQETSEASSESEENNTSDGVNGTNSGVPPEREYESEEITEEQQEILRRIQEYPAETQREIADRFDVSTSTINRRLNSITGFEWNCRQEFATAMLDNNSSSQDEATPETTAVEDLTEQVQTLTEQVESLQNEHETQSASVQSPFGNPDLACKIARECMKSDNVTEQEETQILKNIIATTGYPE